jgi:hypothetical protein
MSLKNDAKSRIDIVTKDNASGASSLFDGNKSTNELTLIKQIQQKWFKRTTRHLHSYISIQHQIEIPFLKMSITTLMVKK